MVEWRENGGGVTDKEGERVSRQMWAIGDCSNPGQSMKAIQRKSADIASLRTALTRIVPAVRVCVRLFARAVTFNVTIVTGARDSPFG